LEILLVTTRQSKQWIIPKGWPIKGLQPAKSAAREAFEETGVRGRVGGKSIGLFAYNKMLDGDRIWVNCEVRVFPLLVKHQSETGLRLNSGWFNGSFQPKLWRSSRTRDSRG
jgi:8-oxo-dGTP pyrophosphatase MutT (NUDIX family)